VIERRFLGELIALENRRSRGYGDGHALVLHELYPSTEALDGAVEGMEGGMPQQFEQLDELLLTLGASAGRS
jgi:hypothetical protein